MSAKACNNNLKTATFHLGFSPKTTWTVSSTQFLSSQCAFLIVANVLALFGCWDDCPGNHIQCAECGMNSVQWAVYHEQWQGAGTHSNGFLLPPLIWPAPLLLPLTTCLQVALNVHKTHFLDLHNFFCGTKRIAKGSYLNLAFKNISIFFGNYRQQHWNGVTIT